MTALARSRPTLRGVAAGVLVRPTNVRALGKVMPAMRRPPTSRPGAPCGRSVFGLNWIQSYPAVRSRNVRSVLDPTVTEESPPVPPAPRLGDLASKRLGFVDNSKLNADLFLSRIAD